MITTITIVPPWIDYHSQQAPLPWLIAFIAQKRYRKNQRTMWPNRSEEQYRMRSPSFESWLMLATTFIETGEWRITANINT